MGKSLNRMYAKEFTNRLKFDTAQPNSPPYAFFIGAGCSVSSGIPAAGALVKNVWLPRLHNFKATDEPFDSWVHTEFPQYNPNKPAASYGDVIKKLFHDPTGRQLEIERLCDGKFPGFGYAVLSNMIAKDDARFNISLTTNFDDLIADSLYLYAEARPLVIHHESLASFIQPTRRRPLVVKLHGDHRLSPQNTSEEIDRLKKEIESQVKRLLHGRGMIFIGYGGTDHGVVSMLEGLYPEASPPPVYWVSGHEPQSTIHPWLESRNATWVQIADFDEFMMIVLDTFELKHPDKKRFDKVFEQYYETYKKQSGKVASLPEEAPDAEALKEAVKRIDETFPDWWAVALEASRYLESEPDKADKVYRKGLDKFPDSAPLLGTYAVFLTYSREDHEEAEKLYHRALKADPKNVHNLGNYALFLKDIREDHDEAEKYYRRALKADPNDAELLGNYAVFLTGIREDHDEAEKYYRRGLKADPKNANKLGNYAWMLLGSGRKEEGLEYLRRAMNSPDFEKKPVLAVECWFYMFANGPEENRREALAKLKLLLKDGTRTKHWDFSMNIEQAKKEGHPDAEWLEKIAAVITDKEDISILDEWDKWREN